MVRTLLGACLLLLSVIDVVSTVEASEAEQSAYWDELFAKETKDLSAPALKSIQDRLQLSELIHSDFEQQRNIRVLKRPLVSQGHFYYKKNTGVCWALEKPYKAILVIGEKTIMEKSSSGQFVELAGANNAQFDLFSKLFFSVFNGEFLQLGDFFKLYTQPSSDADWVIGLEPKKSLLKKAIERVVVQGNEAITSVTLIDPAGDITRIGFDRPSHTPDKSYEENCFAGS